VWNKGKSAAEWVTRQVRDITSLPNNARRMYFTTNHDETANDQPPVILFRGSAGARVAFVAMAFLPGVPLLYNGEEVEVPQKLTLFEKESIDWNQPNAEKTRAFYAKVIKLERTHPAFAGRDIAPVTTNASNDIIAYRRGNAVVLVNTRSKKQTIIPTGFTITGARDLLSDEVQSSNSIALEGYGAAVLEIAK
jgi:glycosidase